MADQTRTSPKFLIGLNMDGAISAGAYTAGVVDFLIDALECWYRAKADGLRGVPGHDIEICVMSGASAGGMTSAIASAALTEEFHPVRTIPLEGQNTANKLHQSWVERIDISSLLADEDLADSRTGVASVLNSKPIAAIAEAAFHMHPRAAGRRPYVAENQQLILTVTNLRGVPYAVDEGSNIETQIYYYADDRRFTVEWPDGAAGPKADWTRIARAAIATGAFPVMLAAQQLDRTAGDYNHRRWLVSTDDPCVSEEVVIPPHWDLPDTDPYVTLNVDGGVTNNSPFELARRTLAAIPPASPAGRNRRDASQADRAVITIAPFPTSAAFEKNFDPDLPLSAIVGGLLKTLVAQSRFSGENLSLVANEEVFSRFMIAPKIWQPPGQTLNALAGGSLGAFGGFIAREFREHDFQLGRRNCQQFLRKSFVLPSDNPIIAQGVPKEGLDPRFQFIDQGRTWIPIIPLMPDVASEIKVQRPKIDASRIESIAEAAADRLKLVLERELDRHLKGLVLDMGFDLLWRFKVHGRLKEKITDAITENLAAQELLAT